MNERSFANLTRKVNSMDDDNVVVYVLMKSYKHHTAVWGVYSSQQLAEQSRNREEDKISAGDAQEGSLWISSQKVMNEVF